MPWLGDAYQRASREIKGRDDGHWHVMGESHYGQPEEQNSAFTRNVIRQLAIPGYGFFDRLLSIVAREPAADLDREAGWSRLAYSNFVQELLPDTDRRPTASHWAAGREAFFGQLAITRPPQLLIVGRQQWDNLPTEGGAPLPALVAADGSTVEDAWLYAYRVGNETAFTVAVWVYHPSSRGLLNVEAARARVRAVAEMTPSILSRLTEHKGRWALSTH